MANTDLENQLINDPSTSYWLKTQLMTTQMRDPVDALNDAKALVVALSHRLSVIEQSLSPKEEL